jgi:hypothetical protein
MKVVIQQNKHGLSIIHPVNKSAEEISSDLGGALVLGSDFIPSDRTFRNAWKLEGGLVIVDLNAAKEICHTKRREVRAAEFAPWDTKATIPAEADHAETQRQDIRVKYAAIQENIDASEDAAELGSIYAAL